MKQFIKVDNSLIEEKGLSVTEAYAYSLIYDRMNSSVQRREFFDKKKNDYYVIFTNDELALKLGVTTRTVTNVMKSLIKSGFLTIKKQFNKANKIFIPAFAEVSDDNVEENISTPQAKIFPPNQTELNQTKNTYDTNDTEKTELKILAQALIEKGGLSEEIVSTLSAYSNNRADLYNYAGLIYKAKNKVAQRAIKATNGYSATRLETNNLLNETLSEKIQGIITSAEQNSKNKSGYIMSSLINIFEYKANEFMMGG